MRRCRVRIASTVLPTRVAADVLREMVERAAREDRQRYARIQRRGRPRTTPSRHRRRRRAPPPAWPPRAAPPRRRRPRPVRRSRPAARTLATSSMTRAPVPPPDAGLTTSTTPAPSGRARGVHPQRVGGRQLGSHDRRHHPRAEHGDARADAEPGEHVTGIVRPGRHPGQAHQAGQQRQRQTQRRVLQPDADRERRCAGRVTGRQRIRRRRAPAATRAAAP